MTKLRHNQVKVSEFKTHLGKYLREVKAGQEVTVLDRETPVAKLVPFMNEEEEAIEVIPPSQQWHDMRARWIEKNSQTQATRLKKSSLEYLKEDREFK